MSPGVSADLSRLKMELRAIAHVLDSLNAAVQRGLLRIDAPEHAWRVAPIPDEHLVSYA